MTVEEYQVGQLWSVAEASKAETGGGEGVEVGRFFERRSNLLEKKNRIFFREKTIQIF